jgi:hypothetical protein
MTGAASVAPRCDAFLRATAVVHGCVVVNPQVVADYKTSGIFPPRHLEYLKAVQ